MVPLSGTLRWPRGGCNAAIAAELGHVRRSPLLASTPKLTHSAEPRYEAEKLRRLKYPRIRVTIPVILLTGAWRRKLVRRFVESSTRKNVSLSWRADAEGRFYRDDSP
jgi:hypothetical protein